MEEAHPVVSVLVPAHKAHAYLLRASIPPLFTGETPIEVVLVHTGFPGDAPPIDNRVRVIEAGADAGFCRAINIGVEATQGEFLLFSNADLFVTESYVDALVRFLASHPEVACVGGKILRHDPVRDRRTRVVDSAGLAMGRSRRAWDRGEGQPDASRYDAEEEVFGVTGAGLLVRRSALERVRVAGEYLDESFVAYKDDVDLAWRLRLAGLSSWYVPAALAYHARTSRGLGGRAYLPAARAYSRNAAAKPRLVRERSLINQWLLLLKNEDGRDFVRDAPWILGREVLVLGYTVVAAPPTLAMLGALARAAPEVRRKRRAFEERRAVAPGALRRRWFGASGSEAREV